MIEGVLWWITGLAGAGKTTVAHALVKRIEKSDVPVVHFDGDELRAIFNAERSFDHATQLDLAYRYARLCGIVTKRGIDVVCSTMSLFHDVHVENRKRFPRYREILLDVPMPVLEQRDKKGLYSGARMGSAEHVVGVNFSVEFPESPDLVLANDGSVAPEVLAERIYALRHTADLA
jgi:adenylylsulfate kinase